MASSTTITLNDSTTTPWIAYGTGTALYNKDASEGSLLAIRAGFIHLDGAQMYVNEDSLGKGIAASGKPRSELYVTTKLLGPLKAGETVRDTLVASLKKLGLDYVNLFLVHNPLQHQGKLKQVWKEMEAVKNEGLTRSIGVSNFEVKHVKEILEVATIIPAVNQIEYHPYVFKASEDIVKFDKEHGIVTSSYGGLTPLFRAPGGPVDAVLTAIRGRLEKERGQPVTEGQVLIKWLQQKGILVVTTSSKEDRMKEYLDTANVPPLTAEEIQAIEENGSKLHKKFFASHPNHLV